MSAEIVDAEIVMPELSITVEESISINSNFDEFKKALDAKIASYKTELKTEEDFAQAKLDEKELAGIRSGIKESRALLLEQAGELNELLEGLGGSDKLAMEQAGILKKRIKDERDRIKAEILGDACQLSDEFTHSMKSRIENAMKNKKTLESLEKSANDEAEKIIAEIKAVDEILVKFDEPLRHGRTAFLEKSPDAVLAEMERRKAAQEAAIREAKLKEEKERLEAIAKQQEEREAERVKVEEHDKATLADNAEALPATAPEPASEAGTKQTIWKPDLDRIPVKAEKPAQVDEATEGRLFLEGMPVIFGQFKEARLKLQHQKNFDAAEKAAIAINEIYLGLKKQLIV